MGARYFLKIIFWARYFVLELKHENNLELEVLRSACKIKLNNHQNQALLEIRKPYVLTRLESVTSVFFLHPHVQLLSASVRSRELSLDTIAFGSSDCAITLRGFAVNNTRLAQKVLIICQ